MPERARPAIHGCLAAFAGALAASRQQRRRENAQRTRNKIWQLTFEAPLSLYVRFAVVLQIAVTGVVAEVLLCFCSTS